MYASSVRLFCWLFPLCSILYLNSFERNVGIHLFSRKRTKKKSKYLSFDVTGTNTAFSLSRFLFATGWSRYGRRSSTGCGYHPEGDGPSPRIDVVRDHPGTSGLQSTGPMDYDQRRPCVSNYYDDLGLWFVSTGETRRLCHGPRVYRRRSGASCRHGRRNEVQTIGRDGDGRQSWYRDRLVCKNVFTQ